MVMSTQKTIRICRRHPCRCVRAGVFLLFILIWVLVTLVTQLDNLQTTGIVGYKKPRPAEHTKPKSVQAERQSLVAETCQRLNEENRSSVVPGRVDRVFLYESRQVAYCTTHKIASTFWIRVFRWLLNDTRSGRHVPSPLDIPKLDTHLLPLKKLIEHRINSETPRAVRATLDRSYRFLFTREPFARLWSVYIDKFVLPDNYFWSAYAPAIARVSAPKPGAAAENGAKPRLAARRCLNVTFGDFLRYIVSVDAKETGQELDDHFRPVHYGCNPCRFQPQFIGKVESMREDSAAVLTRMGLDDLIPTLSGSDHVQQEIDMLVAFNFYLVVTKGYQAACVSKTDLERRLLKAFVYNGYISEEDESDLLRRIPLGKEMFEKAVLDAYTRSNRTSADAKTQRTRFKVEAYASVPKDLLYSVQKVFHWDFQLFGYEPFPSDIFDR